MIQIVVGIIRFGIAQFGSLWVMSCSEDWFGYFPNKVSLSDIYSMTSDLIHWISLFKTRMITFTTDTKRSTTLIDDDSIMRNKKAQELKENGTNMVKGIKLRTTVFWMFNLFSSRICHCFLSFPSSTEPFGRSNCCQRDAPPIIPSKLFRPQGKSDSRRYEGNRR